MGFKDSCLEGVVEDLSDDALSPSCTHLSPLFACCPPSRGGSQDQPLYITDAGVLLVRQLGGEVVCVTRDGIAEGGLGLVDSPASRVLWGDLDVGPIIGVGGHAVVHRALHRPSGTLRALKVIRTEGFLSQTPSVVLRELAHLLRTARHPNLVTSEQAFYRDSQLLILMEHMDCGDLRSVLQHTGPLPLPILTAVTRQVLLGLSSLHDRQIVHRDIKPSNLLLHSSGCVKISDFGIASLLPRNSSHSSDIAGLGSHAYMSPERLNGESCGPPCDVWSLGLTVAQAALGVYPFLPDDIVFNRFGVRRESTSSGGRQSTGSRNLLSPMAALVAPTPDRDSSPDLSLPPTLTLFASPRSAASPTPGCLLRVSTRWTPVKRASFGTAISGSSSSRSNGDGNPFHHEVNIIEFSLMLQDPLISVDFDKLAPLVREWYPHWPQPELTEDLRNFTQCCVQHSPSRRWLCGELSQHPLLQHAAGAEELSDWMRHLPKHQQP